MYNSSYNTTIVTAITQSYRPSSKCEYVDVYYKINFYIKNKPELFDYY